MLIHRIFNQFSFCVDEIPNTMFEQQRKNMEINSMFLYINHVWRGYSIVRQVEAHWKVRATYPVPQGNAVPGENVGKRDMQSFTLWPFSDVSPYLTCIFTDLFHIGGFLILL